MSIGLPKNSPYKKFLTRLTEQIKENGVLQLTRQRWHQEVKSCPVTPVRPINLEKVFTLGFLIMGGMLLALVILAVELVLSQSRGKMLKHEQPIRKRTPHSLDDIIRRASKAEMLLLRDSVSVYNVQSQKQEVLETSRLLLELSLDLKKLQK